MHFECRSKFSSSFNSFGESQMNTPQEFNKQSSFTTMKKFLSIIIRATMQPRYLSDHLNKSNDLECDGRRDGQGKRFYE
jgi:hypothetical protein